MPGFHNVTIVVHKYECIYSMTYKYILTDRHFNRLMWELLRHAPMSWNYVTQMWWVNLLIGGRILLIFAKQVIVVIPN